METGGRFRIDSLALLADLAYVYVRPRQEVLEAAGIRVLEPDTVAAQLTDAERKLDNLYRAVEEGALDLSILAPRIRVVKAQVDDLTAKRDALATAGTPVVRLADDATIARYVERLHATLATGSVNAQRSILRSWISRIEADGTELTGTFTLPPDVGGGNSASGGPTNERPNDKTPEASREGAGGRAAAQPPSEANQVGLTQVLPRVETNGGGGSRTLGEILGRTSFDGKYGNSLNLGPCHLRQTVPCSPWIDVVLVREWNFQSRC